MKWFLTAILLGVISPAYAQQYLTKNGEVVFLSQASLSEFEGKSNSLQGLIDLDKNLLDFYLDLNTLDTGIGLRDKHMRENYLETEEFPFAEFTGKLSAVQKPEPGKVQQVTAIGKFKLHGVERDITVKGTLSPQANGSLILEAKFSVLLRDYQIEVPKLVFYELAPEQQVSIKATLTTKK
jgi:polyisoprenoid-binding protein YceI